MNYLLKTVYLDNNFAAKLVNLSHGMSHIKRYERKTLWSVQSPETVQTESYTFRTGKRNNWHVRTWQKARRRRKAEQKSSPVLTTNRTKQNDDNRPSRGVLVWQKMRFMRHMWSKRTWKNPNRSVFEIKYL